MDYSKLTILMAVPNEPLARELEQAGVARVLLPEGKTMRAFFTDALRSADSPYFVSLDPSQGFSAADVLRVADAVLGEPSRVFVGVRGQEGKKSLPQNAYSFLSGVDIGDVQSSLIAMSRENLQLITQMKSKEKLFAQNILLEARQRNLPITGVPVQTTLAQAPGWGLLTSSFKLYVVFIKFGIAAFLAYLVDIGTFYLFQKLFSGMTDEYKILTATVLSRILCSVATYLLNKGAVFNSQSRNAGVVLRFIILAAAQLIASWLLVWGIGSLLGGSDAVNTMLKIIVDLVIFLVSFSIQRDWVFKEKDGAAK